MYIICTGNPCEGFNYIGPFEDHDDAVRQAENVGYESWWIIELQPKD